MAASDETGKPSVLTCKQAATVDTELHIRHGAALMLRGMRWLVTDQKCDEPLIGRPVLESLGLNTEEILAAAAERHGGEVDMSNLFPETSNHDGPGRVSRVFEGVYHVDGGADDADLEVDDGWVEFGPEDPVEKQKVLDEKMEEAKRNNLSTEGQRKLRAYLHEYSDIIKMKLDGGPPANIEPLQVKLLPNAVPLRAKHRRYAPAKKRFMTRYVRQLLKLGFAKTVTSPEWVSASMIVPKPPPALFRLVMDYQPVNSVTIPTFWPMPNIDADLAETRGATVFAGIDFCSSYWQASLHQESQRLFAFMTPDGVVMPTRTPQGACNSAANFQEKIEQCFADLRDNFRAWLDDYFIFAMNEEELLRILRRFFEICRDRNLIVSLPKSSFFLEEVTWCGRLIDASGVRFNPKNLSGLQHCDSPQSAAELSEYVHSVTWVSSSIPRFAERIAPLRELLERAYEKAGGSRKKRSIAKFSVAGLGWNELHEQAFKDLQDQLCAATRLAHRNPEMTLCIHTDASDKYWAVCATQCHPNELQKDVGLQHHEPLAFLSGSFTEREMHWTTYEREAFAVVQAFRKLD